MSYEYTFYCEKVGDIQQQQQLTNIEHHRAATDVQHPDHDDAHVCCCVYEWLNLESVIFEYKRDTSEVVEFLRDQMNRERCA